MHQLSAHRHRADEAARYATALAGMPEPAADFEELALLHLRLSGQRREVAEASRMAAGAAVAVTALAVLGAVLGTAIWPGQLRITAPPGQPRPAARADAARNGPAVARGASPRPALAVVPSPRRTRATAKATATAADPAPAQAGCGTSLADVWADWAMPNSPGTGLPNPASYTDLGNGTVRDNVTGLRWQRTPAPGTYTFTQAKAYCAGLNLAGGSWHLPTRIQLMSIIDTSRSGPAIDTEAFPGTAAAYFWTSSPWVVTKTPLRA